MSDEDSISFLVGSEIYFLDRETAIVLAENLIAHGGYSGDPEGKEAGRLIEAALVDRDHGHVVFDAHDALHVINTLDVMATGSRRRDLAQLLRALCRAHDWPVGEILNALADGKPWPPNRD